jgi:hypothetical protein
MECLNDYRNIIKMFLEESIVESSNDANCNLPMRGLIRDIVWREWWDDRP